MDNPHVIKLAKDWVHGEGLKPSRIVLVNWTKNTCTPFSTHIEVKNPDGATYLILGHYFYNKQDAIQDYKLRNV